MILDNMTPEEVTREIKNDIPNLARKLRHNLQDIRRLALKTKDFPLKKYIEWTSPRKNRWTVTCVIKGRKVEKHGVASSFYITADGRNGKTVYVVKITEYDIDECEMEYDGVMKYTPHFFKRYKERMELESLLPEDAHLDFDVLVKVYMSRNHYGAIDISKEDRRHAWKDEEGYHLIQEDGIAMGRQLTEDFVVLNTFLTSDMLFKGQREQYYSTETLGNFILSKADSHLCLERSNVSHEDVRNRALEYVRDMKVGELCKEMGLTYLSLCNRVMETINKDGGILENPSWFSYKFKKSLGIYEEDIRKFDIQDYKDVVFLTKIYKEMINVLEGEDTVELEVIERMLQEYTNELKNNKS